MATRFTIDGSPQLEMAVARICEQVRGEVLAACGGQVRAIVLGGGYGRGEGGVLVEEGQHRPYNDLDFYVFIRLASRLRACQAVLNRIADTLSEQAGVHVELKAENLRRFSRSPVSMFSYDLVAGHRVILGSGQLLARCDAHRDPANIPVSEATRLLLNRCSGLLFCKQVIRSTSLTPDETDFVTRNIAKAQLAFGDAVLTALGRYHWSCLERRQRVGGLKAPAGLDLWPLIQHHHVLGVEFKLHPVRSTVSPALLASLLREVCDVGAQLWLWLESQRLRDSFDSAETYVIAPSRKCNQSGALRNVLLNIRSFGWRGALNPMAFRYPRERLLNSLPVLLWTRERCGEPQLRRHIQRQLATKASDWEGLVAAYRSVWPSYG